MLGCETNGSLYKYLPWIEVAVPNAALLAVLRTRELYCAVLVLVVKLQSYNITLVDGIGAWDM